MKLSILIVLHNRGKFWMEIEIYMLIDMAEHEHN